MKLARVLSRLALLSLAAALFVGLTTIYGGTSQFSLPSAHWQAERGHRQPWPEVWKVDEFIGAGGLVALWALMGRIMFRLRLSPAPRSQAILLGFRSPYRHSAVKILNS